MFDKMNYKSKIVLLSFGSFLLLVVGYSISVTPTIDLYEQTNQKKAAYQQAIIGPEKLLSMEKELNVINKSVGNVSTNFEDFQDKLLEVIIPFTNENDIKLSEIREPHFYVINGYEVQTITSKIIGNYKYASLLIEHIQKESIGRIGSIKYELKKDQKTKKEYLETTLYIQNFKAI